MNINDYPWEETAPEKARGVRHKFVILEYEGGLLYRDGKLVEQLGAGKHVRWGFGWALSKADLRKRTIAIPGQELLTADNVGLKLSLAVTFAIVDPLKALHEVQDWSRHLYTTLQVAVRRVIASRQAEALLTERLVIGTQVLEDSKGDLSSVGISLEKVEVKDVMFPGEIKKVFGEVLKAKQEALAALERARGENAAMRNLANTARLLENNPALQNLRLLQTVQTTNGNTFVVGLPNGFAPLTNSAKEKQQKLSTTDNKEQ